MQRTDLLLPSSAENEVLWMPFPFDVNLYYSQRSILVLLCALKYHQATGNFDQLDY